MMMLLLMLIDLIALSSAFSPKIGTTKNHNIPQQGYQKHERLRSPRLELHEKRVNSDVLLPSSSTRSRSLTPNHILYPLYFPYNATNSRQNEGALEPLSFPSALIKMTETLENIVKSSGNQKQLELKLGGPLFPEKAQGSGQINGDSIKINENHMNINEFKTIQIMQKVNHPVDTLCWLHANQPRIEALNPLPSQKPPIIYLSNAENTFEAVSIGSALTMRNLHLHDDSNKDWEIIQNLPQGSGVYGGQRFDSEAEISDEWKDFGKELWILPSVELRQQKVSSASGKKGDYDMSLMIHLHFNSPEMLVDEARKTLDLLQKLNADVSTSEPCTTLPPILSRGYNPDAQEVFEKGIHAALDQFEAKARGDSEGESCLLDKVVLASRADLKFGSELNGLDVIKKLKFGGSRGHLFYMNPGKGTGKEFLGCTPERLFQVRGDDGAVISEALAGTRPRGSTPEADAELLHELMHSGKDRRENIITGEYIRNVFDSLQKKNMIKVEDKNGADDAFFVRRLSHVQHICQSVEGKMTKSSSIVSIARHLLDNLHPTPAVCGSPNAESFSFIRDYEGISFDRGMYAGPFGFLGADSADIIVAIRSALLTKELSSNVRNNVPPSTLSIYAGAGIVPGSTVQSEWSEVGYKLGVLSSTFTQSPLTLSSYQTPNEAWATVFVEELIRSGVTQFYVCPGSRSTPLTTALARAMRSHIGVIDCISTHDERGAAFRALGHARATRKAAAVVTSSGTAVANLYPAVMEASMDGVPLLLLTADRPYENRDTGANQAVDQVKVFSDSYIRWFRDISPPSDDVPVSLALSDANHAVTVTNQLLGPVHLNIQFRENLAPDAGPIRGDSRSGSTTSFSTDRFTDIANFQRWSANGKKWSQTFSSFGLNNEVAMYELANAIVQSKRGIIVVGNLRNNAIVGGPSDSTSTAAIISDFAETIGLPIFAGAQCANLRFYSSAVIPYADHLLKNQLLQSELKPDLIIQIGSHLVSTEVQGLITKTMKEDSGVSHFLLHTTRPAERVDAGGTITHQVFSDVDKFLPNLQSHLNSGGFTPASFGSSLTPLVLLGRAVANEIPSIIHEASKKVTDQNPRVWESSNDDTAPSLTEPQVMLAMTEVLSGLQSTECSKLFLSNSMPVRDAEFFLYPSQNEGQEAAMKDKLRISSVAVNRGASGIDGIVSSATGFAEATAAPTTLLIGDLATLHDLNAFHSLSRRSAHQNSPKSTNKPLPLSTVVVNNDGGGIFSFLPIAKHGNDVNFEEFFGTPTNSFSFQKGAEAFGLPFVNASDYGSFKTEYKKSLAHDEPSILEAQVVDRNQNVQVHAEITKLTTKLIDNLLGAEQEAEGAARMNQNHLPVVVYESEDSKQDSVEPAKTFVMLHGWMGDKYEWKQTALALIENLPDNWKIISIDLPGHGDAPILSSSKTHMIQSLNGEHPEQISSIDDVAKSVIKSLKEIHGVDTVDAIAGYSLGGRVALAMKKTCSKENKYFNLDMTKMFVLGSFPGSDIPEDMSIGAEANIQRRKTDDLLANDIFKMHQKLYLSTDLQGGRSSNIWEKFISKWYGAHQLWGDLEARNSKIYSHMIIKRVQSLQRRAPDLAHMLKICSPGRNTDQYWKYINSAHIVYIAGQLDHKYSSIGKDWSDKSDGMKYYEIEGSGHALLAEAPLAVATIISETLTKATDTITDTPPLASNMPSLPKDSVSTELSISYSQTTPSIIDLEEFRIDLSDGRTGKGARGIGWGDEGNVQNKLNERRGLVISLSSRDGYFVGIGEISPLKGVHTESFEDAKNQIQKIQNAMHSRGFEANPIDCEKIFTLDGSLHEYIESFLQNLQKSNGEILVDTEFFSSVRSGLEMALLSLASHAVRVPLPKSLTMHLPKKASLNPKLLPMNGLVTRAEDIAQIRSVDSSKSSPAFYPSMKVKVGHQSPEVDAINLINIGNNVVGKALRADANRAWSKSDAKNFARTLIQLEPKIFEKLEFIEEPIQKVDITGRVWSFSDQVEALENWHIVTGLKYALDESLADAIFSSEGDFTQTLAYIHETLENAKGCAAIVLKPSLLGIERSMHLSRLAHGNLGIGAVFTSTFDSGVGLAHIAFLASLSDSQATNDQLRFAHGLSTFSMLKGDTLTPAFESYANSDGLLNVASLGRAMQGLGLDEIRDYIYTRDGVEELEEQNVYTADQKFSSTSSASDQGREISIHVSLPLPFSDEVACSRFTDLPQQPRWSPWINSVAYLGKGKTEWTLNVRGIEFRWKADSKLLNNPKGIMWESTSGLKNKGRVEFIKVSDTSCLMRVKMSIITPRLIALAFKTSGEFVKDFVERKLLKWSLESFRDVVKADLALERGDAELGDALFDAVEGRSNAIEATLSYSGFEDPI